MCRQVPSSNHKFVHLWSRLLKRGKILLKAYLDYLYLHLFIKIKREYSWQGDQTSFGYSLTEAIEAYSRNLK